MKKHPTTVAISGGFDPIHIGHIRMIEKASKLGDKLIVIINNDNWLKTKKGFVFMPEVERSEIIKALSGVDDVVLTKHKANDPDSSVCNSLMELKPDIFANGGDRKNEKEIPESATCKKYGIKMVFNIGEGGKVQSSSWLTNKIVQKKIERRPWGSFEIFTETPSYWVKHISVLPNHRLSLQKHYHRDETWICVEGEVIAQVEDKEVLMKHGDKITFKAGVIHRLSSKKGGSIIEIAHGNDVRESDIERIEDDYGRA